MRWLEPLTLCWTLMAATSAWSAEAPSFGHPLSEADIAAWDISVEPDGAGLPRGGGTAAQGETVYVAKCQACHGDKGAGKPNDTLAGGAGSLSGERPLKTVGSYWPYATTLFDYIRRAMPWDHPKSLTDDEVYAASAYILFLNGLVGHDDVVDARSLPTIRMPNRDGFIPFPRPYEQPQVNRR
jgi:S-disulfanyl-L-cysteine oxidoreductase SoxD